MGAQACCLSLRALATAEPAAAAAASPDSPARAPLAPATMVAPAPAAQGAGHLSPPGGPVLLPISRRRSRPDAKPDAKPGAGDDLPKAGSPGAGVSASPAVASPARSRRSERRVTFGGEEMQEFEAVGRMRSVR